MITIRKLVHLAAAEFPRLIVGYESDSRFVVQRTAHATGWTFTLEEVPRTPPYRKRYDHLNAATIAEFQRILSLGFSFGAYDEARCVGLAIADVSDWNQTYRVHELHTAPSYQRRGVGRQLVDALVRRGRAAKLRILLCETQTTNVPAMRFYLKTGFTLEGLDLSHYRNDDYPVGEMAVYMKKRLTR